MIKEFKGDYHWLSNFAPCKIILLGFEYRSVEHAYMSAKSHDCYWKLFCLNTESAGKIKRASKEVELVEDWDTKKLLVMRKCLEQKYSQEPYKSALILTGTEEIQEGNWWNDTFWGIDLKYGEGKNTLGILIMTIRKWLMEKKQYEEFEEVYTWLQEKNEEFFQRIE